MVLENKKKDDLRTVIIILLLIIGCILIVWLFPDAFDPTTLKDVKVKTPF